MKISTIVDQFTATDYSDGMQPMVNNAIFKNKSGKFNTVKM